LTRQVSRPAANGAGERLLVVTHVRTPRNGRWQPRRDAVTVIAPRRPLELRIDDGGKPVSVTLRRGDIALIPPAATEYQFGSMDALVATVPSRLVSRALPRHAQKLPDLTFRPVPRARDPVVTALVGELWDELEQGRPNGGAYSEAIGTVLVGRLVKRYGPGTAEARNWGLSRDDERIRRTLDFLEARLTDKVSLAEIARDAGLSVPHLIAVFKEATGETISAYLRRRRLHKAHELLRETSLKISEVAERVGYASTPYFATAFKAAFGVAPGASRRRRP
jgi:AraC-like DNA-binding protein